MADVFMIRKPNGSWSDSVCNRAHRLNVVKGFRNSEIKRWAGKHLEPSSLVYSDGLACFSAVLDHGCHHYSIVTGGGPDSVTKEEFAWVNTMIGNVKRSIKGT